MHLLYLLYWSTPHRHTQFTLVLFKNQVYTRTQGLHWHGGIWMISVYKMCVPSVRFLCNNILLQVPILTQRCVLLVWLQLIQKTSGKPTWPAQLCTGRPSGGHMQRQHLTAGLAHPDQASHVINQTSRNLTSPLLSTQTPNWWGIQGNPSQYRPHSDHLGSRNHEPWAESLKQLTECMHLGPSGAPRTPAHPNPDYLHKEHLPP